MNPISASVLQKANIQALYNTFLYLAPSLAVTDGSTVSGAISTPLSDISEPLSRRNLRRLEILSAAAQNSPRFANSTVSELTLTPLLSAALFTEPDGNISVCFGGTGGGEWIDNGEGLSGVPEQNTYITYGDGGTILSQAIVDNDYATDRQVEALNWFNRLASQNAWSKNARVTVSGHSKGGNKAQFVAMCSELVSECYSFDGQGFSPEAVNMLQNRYYADFDLRRKKIFSISADNDYVNVLGSRLMPDGNIHFFRAKDGLHHIDSILSPDGRLNLHCEQGMLSEFVQRVSEDVMGLEPQLRSYATLGIMNVFREFFGDRDADDADDVSMVETIAGISMGIAAVLHRLKNYERLLG